MYQMIKYVCLITENFFSLLYSYTVSFILTGVLLLVCPEAVVQQYTLSDLQFFY